MKTSPHQQRKVTFQEYGALLAVEAMLKANILKFETVEAMLFETSAMLFETSDSPLLSGRHLINMNVSGYTDIKSCSSIGCIGGNMAIIMGLFPVDYICDGQYSASLQPLFFPPAAINWNKLKNKEMLAAIANWKKDGKPRWEKIAPHALKKSR